jgi:aspartate kinase
MIRIVQKFGGTSLATVELIKKAALHTKQAWDQGQQVAVVVSAMAGTTNELVSWVQQTGLSHALSLPESDTVLSAGEQITSGLFALCLQEYGISSRSWQAWQIPLITVGPFGNSSISSIEPTVFFEGFEQSIIPVLSGFQGMQNQRITTLGRGGSDTTAVALAAAIKADYCMIFTDVEGVYTTDPQLVPTAKKMPVIGYEEMLEMASLGAKVLHPRAVEIAFYYKVKIQVLSSFIPVNEHCGTWIMETDQAIEATFVRSIAYQLDQIKITIYSLKEKLTFLEQFLLLIYTNHLIIDNVHHQQGNDFQETTFLIHKNQQGLLQTVLKQYQQELQINQWQHDDSIAKISLIGRGLKRDNKIIYQLLQAFYKEKIALSSLTQSETVISVFLPKEQMEYSLRMLHTLYSLDKDNNHGIN